jgi:transketolase
MSSLNANQLVSDCRSIRRSIVETLYAIGGGHYGGALSVVEILTVLCREFVYAEDTADDARDKLILSKGHAAIALYATWAHCGRLDAGRLRDYGEFQSGLEGHPDMTVTPGIDFSTGSLGQGLSVGVGMALAMRDTGRHVWAVLGDGECQEGQVWEAAAVAARCRIANLTAIVDANGAQDFGFGYDRTIAQSPMTALPEIWRAFGWNVLTVDGHCVSELHDALSRARSRESPSKPTAIIANTRKGAGVCLFEQNPNKYHCTGITPDEHRLAMEELAND